MTIGASTTDAFAAIPKRRTCEFCGRELATTSVMVLGREIDGLPCYASCGCTASRNRYDDASGVRRADGAMARYARAGIGRRFMAADVDVGKWVAAVSEGRSLYAHGSNGTYKTTWAAALAMRLIDAGKSVRFENARDVMSEINGIFGGGESDVLDRLWACDVLVLDDLGKEQPTAHAVSMLYEVVDMRYRDAKPIVVTTNFTRGELAGRWATADRATAEAIVSRLCDGVQVVAFDGEDARVVA